MGTIQRAYNRELKNFTKTLKRPLRLIAQIMPVGFTDKDFYEAFKKYYPNLWLSICDLKAQYDMMDDQRRKKDLRVLYCFQEPDVFLEDITSAIRSNTRHKHKEGQVATESEIKDLEVHLIKSRDKKIEKATTQKEGIANYLQFATPSYTNYYIQSYFAYRGQTQERVNARYAILVEASKFRCEETITFMLKVNAIEPNTHLRQFAFETLQKKFGFPQIMLKRSHGRGEKFNIEPEKVDTPQKLLQAIENSQLESKKSFDVFLSHSSLDEAKVIDLKGILNRMGLNVYVDWIEDRTPLKRDLTSPETAKVIIDRIKHSKAVLYVETSNSSHSVWTPWELGYAHALGKRICVLSLETVLDTPEYLGIYPRAVIQDDNLWVTGNETQVAFDRWVKGK